VRAESTSARRLSAKTCSDEPIDRDDAAGEELLETLESLEPLEPLEPKKSSTEQSG